MNLKNMAFAGKDGTHAIQVENINIITWGSVLIAMQLMTEQFAQRERKVTLKQEYHCEI